MTDKNPEKKVQQQQPVENDKKNTAEELPVHMYTRLLGVGVWKSTEAKPHPEEGDELELPRHHHPEI